VLGRHAWFPWVKGSLSGTKVFGVVPFSDPLAALEILLASRAFTWTLLAGAAIVLFLYALLGRVFCGWLCPLGLLCDVNDDLRRYARRRRLRLPEFAVPHAAKYWLLAFFLLVSLFSAYPVFTSVSPINIVGWAAVFGFGPELLAIAVILAVEHFSPRVFCRSLCPLGALYALVGRAGRLRVRVDPARAGQILCRRCTTHCPMGIRVMEEYAMVKRASVSDPECTRCGTCVDVCPNSVLRLGVRRTGPLDTPLPEECETCRLSRDTISSP
jgi:ferredoxin-type protein NapH